MTDSGPLPEPDGEGRGSLPPWIWIAGGIVVVLLVVAGVIIVANDGGDDTATTGSQRSTTTSGARLVDRRRGRDHPSGRGCHLDHRCRAACR